MKRHQNKFVAFALAFYAIIFLGSFFYGKLMSLNFKIIGEGMNPTFEEFDYVALGKTKELSRGDIVIYQSPVSTYEGHKVPKILVGRVVAVETDMVGIQKDKLIINEKEIAEPYKNITSDFTISPPVNVPFDHYFIIQDKRHRSYGSHLFGPVPSSNILGKVLKVYKRSRLGFKEWTEYITGIILILLFIAIPFVFYRRVRYNKILKLLMILFMAISLLFLSIVIAGTIIDQTIRRRIWMLPIYYFHNIKEFIKFIFVGSDIANFVTVFFAWAGGILSVREIGKIYKRKRSITKRST
jgi:signal peptidase I